MDKGNAAPVVPRSFIAIFAMLLRGTTGAALPLAIALFLRSGVELEVGE